MFCGSNQQAVCSERTGGIFTQKLNLEGMSNGSGGNSALSASTWWDMDHAQRPACPYGSILTQFMTMEPNGQSLGCVLPHASVSLPFARKQSRFCLLYPTLASPVPIRSSSVNTLSSAFPAANWLHLFLLFHCCWACYSVIPFKIIDLPQSPQ